MAKLIKLEASNIKLLSETDYVTNSANSIIGTHVFKVNKILITNYSTNEARIEVLLDGKTVDGVTYDDYYISGLVIIPPGVSLILDDSFSMNVFTHDLKINNTGTTPKLTIRIDT